MNRIIKSLIVTAIVIGMACTGATRTANSTDLPEYKIITAPYAQDLESKVFGKLVDGYELRGDLIVVKGNHGLEYIQAVTKGETNEW